ncbi:unnamed protein product [Eretmochelys imbricata]
MPQQEGRLQLCPLQPALRDTEAMQDAPSRLQETPQGNNTSPAPAPSPPAAHRPTAPEPQQRTAIVQAAIKKPAPIARPVQRGSAIKKVPAASGKTTEVHTSRRPVSPSHTAKQISILRILSTTLPSVQHIPVPRRISAPLRRAARDTVAGRASAAPQTAPRTPTAGGARVTPQTAPRTPTAGGARVTPQTAPRTPTAGGARAAPQTALRTPTAGGARAAPQTAPRTPTAGGARDAPQTAPRTPTAGVARATPQTAPRTPTAGGARAAPQTALRTPTAGGARAAPQTALRTPTAGGARAAPQTAPRTPTAGGARDAPQTAPRTPTAGGARATPQTAPRTPTAGGASAAPQTALRTPTAGGPRAAPQTAPRTQTAGGASAAPQTTLQTPTAGGPRAAPQTAPRTPTAGGARAAPQTAPRTPTAGGARVTPQTALRTPTAGGTRAAPQTALRTPTAGGARAAPQTALRTPNAGGIRAAPQTAPRTPTARGIRATPRTAQRTLAARGVSATPQTALQTPTIGGASAKPQTALRAPDVTGGTSPAATGKHRALIARRSSTAPECILRDAAYGRSHAPAATAQAAVTPRRTSGIPATPEPDRLPPTMSNASIPPEIPPQHPTEGNPDSRDRRQADHAGFEPARDEVEDHEGEQPMVRAVTPWQAAWSEELQAAASFDDFDLLLDRLTQEMSAETARRRRSNQENAPPACRTPAPNLNTTTRGARSRDTSSRYDPAAASRIQKLYRANRSKTVREILDRPSPYCTIPSEHLYSYFKDVFDHTAQNDAQRPESLHPLPLVDKPGVLETDFTPREVMARLSKIKNTAPGKDGIRYSLLKKRDPSCLVLATLFNHCKRFYRTPSSWKKTMTVLVYKKGERDDPSNWRPISLCSTISKLYASCLASRITERSVSGGAISSTQKGFMSCEGCYEHHVVLQTTIEMAERARRQCTVAWLDLANAFGSMPHHHIFATLQEFGMPENFLHVIQEVYEGCSTTIRSVKGETAEIPISSAVPSAPSSLTSPWSRCCERSPMVQMASTSMVRG